MDKRQEKLNQIDAEIRTNQSNADRTFLLTRALKLLGEVLKKRNKIGTEQEKASQEWERLGGFGKLKSNNQDVQNPNKAKWNYQNIT